MDLLISHEEVLGSAELHEKVIQVLPEKATVVGMRNRAPAAGPSAARIRAACSLTSTKRS